MAEYSKENRGAVWRNKKKREGKQDADFTGSLNVNGVEFWVNAWKRKDDASADAPALSFSIRPKEDQGQQPAPKRADPISSGRPRVNADMDDDIPFSAEFR